MYYIFRILHMNSTLIKIRMYIVSVVTVQIRAASLQQQQCKPVCMCMCVCGACMCVCVTKHTCHHKDCGGFIIPHFNWQILFKTNIPHPHTPTLPHTNTHTQTLQQSKRQLNRKAGAESIPHPPLNDIPLNVFLLFRKKSHNLVTEGFLRKI